MEIANFDALGRLTLPIEAAAPFGLGENSRLVITMPEAENRLLLRPIQEAPPVASMAEIKQQADMLRQPAGRWRYVRALDDRRRVVLPRPMREWLGWSEETRLQIGLAGDALYVQEAGRD